MTDAVQHYFPASLIGNFSFEGAGRRRRRPVHTARRGVGKVLTLKAEEFGRLPRNPQPYGSDWLVPLSLDGLLQKAESGLEKLIKGLESLESSGSIEAEWFVMLAAPYLGHLLARHPKLDALGIPDLTLGHQRPESYMNRYGLIGVLIEAVLFRTHWTLALSPPEMPWVETDIGMVWLPGRDAGSVLLPITPRYAVLLASGKPTYEYGRKLVSVRSYEWALDDVAVVNDLMALLAPREVYARDKVQAEHVLAVWAGKAAGSENRDGVAADVLAGFEADHALYPLLQDRLIDPSISIPRFIAANHLFACNCEASISRLPPQSQDAVRATMHRDMEAAVRSLRHERSMPDRASKGLTGISLSNTKNICAIADRRGFRVIAPMDGEKPRYVLPKPFPGTSRGGLPANRMGEALVRRAR